MKATKSIRMVLRTVFLILEKDSKLVKPNKWQEFKVIEKEIKSVVLGIGINEDNSAIKIFMIKDFPHYESYDERKYRPTFRIGIPKSCGKTEYWRAEFEDQPINADAGNPQKIANHFIAVNEIISMINVIFHSTAVEPS